MAPRDEPRVGIGWDIHRLVAGHRLVLGGVEVPAPAGFDTHSDGDVLSHAVVDALAGALADGDLGVHYPEDDPDADEARSLDFVVAFAERVRGLGWEVSSLDSFVVLGTVRLRPHLDAMRTNLAAALGVPLDRVSVKARSADGLGPEGTGTAASATVTLLLRPVDPPVPGSGDRDAFPEGWQTAAVTPAPNRRRHRRPGEDG